MRTLIVRTIFRNTLGTWATTGNRHHDEKVVTERAYDNPAFVEDLVRDIAVGLNANDNIDYYRLESENFESIHNHSAYAVIENNKH
jgi:GTP cyclohydrolase I